MITLPIDFYAFVTTNLPFGRGCKLLMLTFLVSKSSSHHHPPRCSRRLGGLLHIDLLTAHPGHTMLGMNSLSSGQIMIFHQPRFLSNKNMSLTKPPFGAKWVVFSVAIIWPDHGISIYWILHTPGCAPPCHQWFSSSSLDRHFRTKNSRQTSKPSFQRVPTRSVKVWKIIQTSLLPRRPKKTALWKWWQKRSGQIQTLKWPHRQVLRNPSTLNQTWHPKTSKWHRSLLDESMHHGSLMLAEVKEEYQSSTTSPLGAFTKHSNGNRNPVSLVLPSYQPTKYSQSYVSLLSCT